MPRVAETSPFGTPAHPRFDTVLLGRLGSELAGVYRDTLGSPLPEGLQLLIERLERAFDGHDQEPAWPDEPAHS